MDIPQGLADMVILLPILDIVIDIDKNAHILCFACLSSHLSSCHPSKCHSKAHRLLFFSQTKTSVQLLQRSNVLHISRRLIIHLLNDIILRLLLGLAVSQTAAVSGSNIHTLHVHFLAQYHFCSIESVLFIVSFTVSHFL